MYRQGEREADPCPAGGRGRPNVKSRQRDGRGSGCDCFFIVSRSRYAAVPRSTGYAIRIVWVAAVAVAASRKATAEFAVRIVRVVLLLNEVENQPVGHLTHCVPLVLPQQPRASFEAEQRPVPCFGVCT